MPVEATVRDLAVGDHRPDRANRSCVPVELRVVMRESEESSVRIRLGREGAVPLCAFNRREDHGATEAILEGDRLAGHLGDAHAAHIRLQPVAEADHSPAEVCQPGVVVKERSPLLPIAVEVQVFHAPRVGLGLELGFRA